ncbi:MAG: hypothetical protein V4598_05780 [Bdellovibrionota bacterium]
MKIFTLLLSLTLSFNIFASTSKLGALIDEHQYFLTVEWDQKDKTVYEDKSREFGRQFNELLVTEKLTRAEVMEVFKAKLINPKVAERLALRMQLLPMNPGAEALKVLVEETKNDIYAQGAAWNGDIDWGMVGTLVGLVVVIALATWYGQSQSAKTYCDYDSTSYGCEDYESPGTYVCTNWGTEWRCTSTTTTDYAGNPRTEQVCGNYNACLGGYFKKD